MSTTELVIQCIILTALIGVFVGAAAVWLLIGEPARRERDALYYANARRRRIEAEDRLGHALYRKHLGTPYIEGHRVYHDNERHSRRVHGLKAVGE